MNSSHLLPVWSVQKPLAIQLPVRSDLGQALAVSRPGAGAVMAAAAGSAAPSKEVSSSSSAAAGGSRRPAAVADLATDADVKRLLSAYLDIYSVELAFGLHAARVAVVVAHPRGVVAEMTPSLLSILQTEGCAMCGRHEPVQSHEGAVLALLSSHGCARLMSSRVPLLPRCRCRDGSPR